MRGFLRSGPVEPRNKLVVRLPVAAAKKLNQLLDEQQDLSVAAGRQLDDETAQRQILRELDARIDTLTAEEGGYIGGNLGLREAIAGKQQQREEAAAELARIVAHGERLRGRRSDLPTKIAAWIEKLDPAAELVMAALPAPKAPATALNRIQAVRARIDKLKSQIEQVRLAPLPSTTLKARMRLQVDFLARRGEPDVMPAILHGRPIRFPETLETAEGVSATEAVYVQLKSPDAFALLAWLQKDELIRRIDAAIDAEADDATAISEEDKKQRIAQIKSEILVIEREECADIEAAASVGQVIAFRDDTSPEAVLGIAVIDKRSPPRRGVLDRLRPRAKTTEEQLAEFGEKLNGGGDPNAGPGGAAPCSIL